MMRRRGTHDETPSEETIRPEVRRQVHQSTSNRKPTKRKASGMSKAFWIVMVFFFISAAAYYLDALINGGS